MRKFILTAGIAALALALVAPIAFAQQGGQRGQRGQRGEQNRGDRMAEMVKALNLTPSQQEAMTLLRDDMRADRQTNREVMKSKHETLRALWQASDPDPNALVAVMTEIANLRLEQRINRMEFRISAKKLLTPAQYETFQAERQMRRGERGHHGKFGARGQRGQNGQGHSWGGGQCNGQGGGQ